MSCESTDLQKMYDIAGISGSGSGMCKKRNGVMLI